MRKSALHTLGHRYVEDLVHNTIREITDRNKQYLVGYKSTLTYKELVEALEKTLEKSYPWVPVDRWQLLRAFPKSGTLVIRDGYEKKAASIIAKISDIWRNLYIDLSPMHTNSPVQEYPRPALRNSEEHIDWLKTELHRLLLKENFVFFSVATQAETRRGVVENVIEIRIPVIRG